MSGGIQTAAKTTKCCPGPIEGLEGEHRAPHTNHLKHFIQNNVTKQSE